MRILSYNIRHGAGMDLAIDLERLAAVITELDPDAVLLQGVDCRVERSGGVDQMARFGQLTGMHHYFGSFMEYGGGEYGMGILTRQAALEWDVEELPAGEEPRFSLWVRLPWATLVNVHLYRTEAQRLAQAQRLIEAFADQAGPVIVGGDFNSEPDGKVMALLADHWTIAPKNGPRLTFPAGDCTSRTTGCTG